MAPADRDVSPAPTAPAGHSIETTPDAAPPERTTTPVELLWDLVFAFAVTQVTTLLTRDLSWAGVARGGLVLALIWWAWSAFVWVTNAQDPDATLFRAVMLLATALIFVTGLALPGAFGSEGLLFAGTYAAVRLLHVALYVDASRRGNASLAAITGFGVTAAIGMALLLAGALLPGAARVLLWLAAAGIDYAGPAWITRNRLRGLQRVAVAHFAERYSLFIIICLGESIVAIGRGAGGRTLSAARIGDVVLALLITIGLWWTYFDRLARRAQERLAEHDDPVLAAADSYSYLHLLLVAGIIAFAVGAREAVASVTAPLSASGRLSLCGGVALYLVGHAAFRLRMLGTVSWPKLVAAAACLLLALVAGVPAWATAAGVMVVLALLVGFETVVEGPRARADLGAAAES